MVSDAKTKWSVCLSGTETSKTSTYFTCERFVWKNSCFKSRFWPDKHRHHQKEFVKANIAEHKSCTTKEAKHQPLPSVNPILFAHKNKQVDLADANVPSIRLCILSKHTWGRASTGSGLQGESGAETRLMESVFDIFWSKIRCFVEYEIKDLKITFIFFLPSNAP